MTLGITYLLVLAFVIVCLCLKCFYTYYLGNDVNKSVPLAIKPAVEDTLKIKPVISPYLNATDLKKGPDGAKHKILP